MRSLYILPITILATSNLFSATWNLDADGNWNVNANWTLPSTFPNAIDAVADFGSVITANRQVTLGQNITIGTINFNNANNYTIAGTQSLIFDVSAGTATFTTSQGNPTISCPVTLNDTLSVTTAGSTVTTFSNSIGGTGGFTKLGPGTVTFTGSTVNTYTGLTTISEGEIVLNKPPGTNNIIGSIQINSGGTLRLLQANQIGNASTVTLQTGGTLNMIAATDNLGTFIFNGGDFLNSGLSLGLFSTGNALTMRDTTITSTVTITNAGSIIFDATNNGTATISGTLLDLRSAAQDNQFIIANGTNPIDMDISAAIVTTTLAVANVTKTGAGTLQFSGTTANTYTGLTTISEGELILNKTGVDAIAGNATIEGGTLSLGASNQIADTSTVTLDSGTFNMSAFSDTINSFTFNAGTMTQTGSSTLTLGASSGNIALQMRNTTIPGNIAISNGGTIMFDITNSGTATINGNVNLGSITPTANIPQGGNIIDMQWNGIVSGTNGINKTGSGRLYLSGTTSNTYTGLTTINGGTLFLNKSNNAVAVPGDISLLVGALTLDAVDQMSTTSNLTQVSPGNFNINADQTFGSYTYTSGTFNSTNNPTMTLTSLGAALTLGTTRTINTPVVISNGGTISMDNGSTLSSNVTLSNGGTITFVGASGTATISGDLNLGSITPTINVLQGSSVIDMQFTGVVSGTNGFLKTGSGRLYLSGTSPNTYTGVTNITGGTLFLNKSTNVTAVNEDINLIAGALTLGADEQIADSANLTQSAGAFTIDTFTETINSYTFNGGTYVSNSGTSNLILNSASTALTMRNTTIGGAVSIANGGSIVFDATNNGTAIISGPLNLNATTPSFNIADGAAAIDMNISSVISSSGAGLTKIGSGNLQFSGTSANTYTGATTISAGTLSLNKTQGINAISDNVTIDGGTLLLQTSDQIPDTANVLLTAGTFNLNGFNESIGSLTFQGGSVTTGAGTLTLTDAVTALTMRNTTLDGNATIDSGGSVVFDATNNGTATLSNGTLTLNATTTFDIADGTASTDMLISDVIAGSGSGITKIGVGTLEFSGTSANTYSGLTTVTAGQLLLNKTAGVNAIAGDVEINGGTLTLGAADQIVSTSTLTLDSGTFDMNGNDTTLGTFIYNGGTFNQGSSLLSLASGTTALSLDGTNISGPLSILNGGSIIQTGAATATISGSLNLNGITPNIDVQNIGITLNISSDISGTAGITTIGPGILEFSGTAANTYSGLTTVTAGQLLLNKTAGVNAIAGDIEINGGTLTLGAADQIVSTSTLTLDSGTFDMNGNDTSLGTYIYNAGTFNQGGALLSLASGTTALSLNDTNIPGPLSILNGGSIIQTGGATATISGSLNLNSITPNIDVQNGGAVLNISSDISGTAGVTKIGPGTLEFSGGTANTYSGLTTVTAGQLLLNKTGVDAIAGDVEINGGTLTLGTAEQIADTSTLTLDSGTFDMAGFDETLGTFIYNAGTFNQGSALLSLASGTTALSLNDTDISGPLSIFNGGSIIQAGASTSTISGSLNLNSITPNIDVQNAGAALNISSDISGTAGITKIGLGTLEFSGSTANTYSGLTTVTIGQLLLNKTGVDAIAGDVEINGGILSLAASDQIADSATVLVTSGAFNLNGFDESISALTFQGGSVTTGAGTLTLNDAVTALTMRNTALDGNVTIASGGSIVFDATNNGTATLSNGTLTLNAPTSFNIANGSASTDMLISDVITGSGVTKIGAGTLEFSGTSANTYNGITTVTAGQLLLNKPAGVDAMSGDVIINGGTLTLGAANQIPDFFSVTLDSGAFDMDGHDETLGTFTYNGGTFTQGGATLSLASLIALQMNDTTISGPLSILNGGAISQSGSGTATISGPLNLNSTTPNIFVNGGATLNISSVISGTAGITKAASGTLEFSGNSANTYSGLTTVTNGSLLLNKTAGVNAIAGDVEINGGTVTLGAADQIASTSTVTLDSGTFDMAGNAETLGTFVYNGGTFTQGGATLSLASNSTALSMGNTTISGPISILNGGSIQMTGNATGTISGPLDINSETSTVDVQNGAATLNISSEISGTAGITKIGSGILEFSGTTANTYSGLTTVTAGELLLNKTADVNAIAGDVEINGGTVTLGAANQIADTSTVTLDSGSFDLAGNAETLATFVYNGGSFTQGGATLSLASNSTALSMGNTTIAGPISILNGGSVVMTGNATGTISGPLNLNSITPTFNVQNASATLNISSEISGTAGVTKIGPGTLEFSGASANTYSGLTTVTAGQLLLDKTAGVNAIAGNVLVNGGTVTLDAADQISDTSTFTLNSGTFNLAGNAETLGTFIYNGGTFTQGGAILSLASNVTALQISNSNTISGPLSILNGGAIVKTGNGTATLSGPLDLNATTPTINVQNGGGSLNISSAISGTAGITKVGSGSLQFSGSSPNTYSGLTTVTAGQLLLNKTAGVNAIAGDIEINGGTVTLGADNQIADTSTLTLNSGTFNLAGHAETLGTFVYNAGTFTQGGATLSLASNGTALQMRNTTISGPISILNGGSVVFDATNNGTATISGSINLNGTTSDFNVGDGSATPDMRVSGNISNGSITKSGPGWLQLTGSNTLNTITINDGTVEGNTNSLTGNITDNASLIFNQNFNGTYSGVLSGTGTFLKEGSGALTFSNASTLDGLSTIAEGTFIVTGSFGGSGDLITNSGTTLRGTGTIAKNTTIQGTLNPGISSTDTGTINFIGDVTLTSGSNLNIDITPTTSDLVNVTGSFTIDPGSTLNLFPLPGSYPALIFYEIVSTTGGVNGTFSHVTSSLPLFSSFVMYSPFDIFIQGFFAPFAELFPKGNAGAVSRCLDFLDPAAGTDLALVIDQLRQIPSVEGLQDALLQLQPSAFTSLALAQENNTFYIRNAITNRLDERRQTCFQDCLPGVHFWMAPIFGYTHQKNTYVSRAMDTEPGYDAYTPGIFAGVDETFSSCTYFGGGFGYTYTDLTWSKNRGSANIHSMYASLYGRTENKIAYLEGILLGAYNLYAIERDISFQEIHRTAFSNHEGMEGCVDLEAGLKLRYRRLMLSPFVNTNYIFIHEDQFVEKGANSLDLYVLGKNSNIFTAEAGIQISQCTSLASYHVPYLEISVIRESRFKGSLEQAAFCPCLGNCSMDVYGLNPSRTLGALTLGLSSFPNENTSFSCFYRGKYGEGFQDHSVYLEYKF